MRKKAITTTSIIVVRWESFCRLFSRRRWKLPLLLWSRRSPSLLALETLLSLLLSSLNKSSIILWRSSYCWHILSVGRHLNINVNCQLSTSLNSLRHSSSHHSPPTSLICSLESSTEKVVEDDQGDAGNQVDEDHSEPVGRFTYDINQSTTTIEITIGLNYCDIIDEYFSPQESSLTRRKGRSRGSRS